MLCSLSETFGAVFFILRVLKKPSMMNCFVIVFVCAIKIDIKVAAYTSLRDRESENEYVYAAFAHFPALLKAIM